MDYTTDIVFLKYKYQSNCEIMSPALKFYDYDLVDFILQSHVEAIHKVFNITI